jgi:phospholipid/cholesterol/gamma-HCH transport system substrate-binding protein
MKTEIKVGIFVIIALALLAYLLLKTEKMPWRKEQGYTIKAQFDNIAGLVSGAEVRVSGFKVGSVQAINLKPPKVEVIMLIMQGVKIHSDARAAVSTIGLLGEKYIEINPGSQFQPVVGPNGYITGLKPTSIDQMVGVLNSIGEEIQNTVEVIRGIVGSEESQSKFYGFLDTFDRLSTHLKDLSAENKEKINETFTSIQRLTEELSKSLPDTARNLEELIATTNNITKENKEALKTAIDNFNSISEKLDTTVEQINQILEKVNQGEGTVGKLLTDEDTHEKIKSTIETIDHTFTRANQMMGGMGKFHISLGFRTQYYSQAEDFKTYFSVKLRPKENRFFLFELVDNRAGYLIETKSTIETIQGERTTRVQEFTSLERQHEFTFSAQVGQQWNNFGLRGGIIESEAGAAVDCFLLGKKISLNLESYDFGREGGPHFKLTSNIFPYKGLFLSGGYDDLIDRDKRQFFFGIGYIF